MKKAVHKFLMSALAAGAIQAQESSNTDSPNSTIPKIEEIVKEEKLSYMLDLSMGSPFLPGDGFKAGKGFSVFGYGSVAKPDETGATYGFLWFNQDYGLKKIREYDIGIGRSQTLHKSIDDSLTADVSFQFWKYRDAGFDQLILAGGLQYKNPKKIDAGVKFAHILPGSTTESGTIIEPSISKDFQWKTFTITPKVTAGYTLNYLWSSGWQRAAVGATVSHKLSDKSSVRLEYLRQIPLHKQREKADVVRLGVNYKF